MIGCEILSLDPTDVHSGSRIESGMLQCLDDTQIGIGESCVFSDHRDGEFFIEVVNPFSHVTPVIE